MTREEIHRRKQRGSRPSSGRTAANEPKKNVTIRLTAEEHLKLAEAGGSAFISEILRNTRVYLDLTKDGVVKVVSTPKFHRRRRTNRESISPIRNEKGYSSFRVGNDSEPIAQPKRII